LKDANGGAVYNQRHGVEMNGLSWIDGAGLVEDNDRKGKWTAKLLKVWDEKKQLDFCKAFLSFRVWLSRSF
jgi:hypothetical protein